MSTTHDTPTTPRHSSAQPSVTQSQSGGPLKAAKTPIGPGAVTYLGALLALVVILVGTVGLQTSAAAAGVTTSRSWLSRAIESTHGLRPLGWALPVGVALVLVGLWILRIGLWPRPKTAVALNAKTGVFLRPRDLAQLAQDAADDVDGVAAVHAQATRAKVTLKVHSTGGPPVGEAVEQAVTQRLGALSKDVRVRVNTKQVAL